MTGKFLVDFLSILFQSFIVHIFGGKKFFIWPYFPKSLQKVQSIGCLDLVFFIQIIFFLSQVFGRFLADSISEHHLAHFWPKKLLQLVLFRKVSSISTVYRLSRFVSLVSHKLIFKRQSFG